jgi:hypothetical protein
MNFVKSNWKLLTLIAVVGSGVGYGVYRFIKSRRTAQEAEQRKAA